MSLGFNSSSGLWKEIRKRAKVTAVEPFSVPFLTQPNLEVEFAHCTRAWIAKIQADGPPAVVYTGQTASATRLAVTCFDKVIRNKLLPAKAAATILMGTTTCFAAVAWTTQSTLKHVKEASGCKLHKSCSI